MRRWILGLALVSLTGCLGTDDHVMYDDGFDWVVAGDCPCNSPRAGLAYQPAAQPTGMPAITNAGAGVVPASYSPPQTKEPPR